MKKIIAFIVVLLVVAAAGAYIYYYQPLEEVKAPESMLPKETVMMVRFDHLKKNIQTFRASPLGSAIEKLDLDAIMGAAGSSLEDMETAKNARNEFISALDSTWFDTLFSETAALALLPVDMASFGPENPEAIAEGFVFVSQTRHPAALVENLGRIFAKDVEIQTEKHGEWEISRIEQDEEPPVYFVAAGKTIFLSLAPEPLMACLDVDAGKRDALTAQPGYQALKTELFESPHTQMSAFCNGAALSALVVDSSRTLGAEPEEVEILRQSLNGFTAAGFAAYDDGSDLLHKRISVLLDKAAMDPAMAKVLDTAPETNKTLAMMPADPLSFSWQNIYNLKTYWDILQTDGRLPPDELAKIRTSVETSTGIAFDELIGAFGEQFGFVLNDVVTTGLFPLPELAMIGEVKQQEVVDTLVDQIVLRTGVQLQEEQNEGTRVRYAIIPFAMGVTPAYACKDGFCILSTNRDLIKTMLSGAGSTPRIKGNKTFASVDKGLTDKNNQVVYIRSGALISKLRDIIAWGSSFSAMADPSSAQASQDIINNLVYPLLDGLKMYETIGIRSLVLDEGEKIQSDIWVRVNRTLGETSK